LGNKKSKSKRKNTAALKRRCAACISQKQPTGPISDIGESDFGSWFSVFLFVIINLLQLSASFVSFRSSMLKKYARQNI
jgi:hypothetical protein